MAGDAKFQLEDILNKVKPPPQILDLVNVKIESQEEFNALIEKIPDYKIKAETVSHQKSFFHQMKSFKYILCEALYLESAKYIMSFQTCNFLD